MVDQLFHLNPNPVLAHLWQVSFLFLLVFGFSTILGKRAKHTTLLLWVIFFFKCITPPVVTSPTSLLGWVTPEVSIVLSERAQAEFEKANDWLPQNATTSAALAQVPEYLETDGRRVDWRQLRFALVAVWLVGCLGYLTSERRAAPAGTTSNKKAGQPSSTQISRLGG